MFPDLKDEDEDFVKENLTSNYHVFERKYDGTAAMISIKDGCLTIWGRGKLQDGSQQNYTDKFPELRDEILSYFTEDCEILGEIVILDKDGNESFNKLQSRTNRTSDIEKYVKKYPASFIAFDIKSLDGDDFSKLLFRHRRNILNNFIPSTETILHIAQATDYHTKSNLLYNMNKCKWEGVVIKGLQGKWGEKQYKFKPVTTEDVFWEGEFVPGKGKNEGLVGSLICYQYINGTRMEVAKVGGGINNDLRKELTMMASDVTKENPRIIEVQTHELLKSGKLRYPQFIRFRTDKSPEQCKRALGDVTKNLENWL